MNKLRAWSVPLGLLVLLIASFGLLIPWLGFYWDDWPVIFTGRQLGTSGFWSFYQFDRPFSAWTYIVTFPLLGSKPINWQVFTLLLRWGTCVAMWWTLILLWPRHRREAAWAAFLFAVYPVFIQQQISVAYSQHWICYLLYFISLGTMVKAYRLKAAGNASGGARWFWPLTGLSLVTALLELFTMEYFAGLELLRPLLLWILVSECPGTGRERAGKVFRLWVPYLLALGIFVTWRLFFLKFPGEDANSPVLIQRLLAEPVTAGLHLLEIALQDISHLLITVWSGILTPATINFHDRFILFSWVVGLLVAGACFFFLLRQPGEVPVQEGAGDGAAEDDAIWVRQALVIGVAAILLGTLPVWITDRQIIAGLYANRFGLAAMFGASLLVVALLKWLIRKPAQMVLVLSLLIGLAASMHLRVANDYRWSWAKQARFYWQLHWRAPDLQPGTTVFSDGEIFPYVGWYSTTMGINLAYPLKQGLHQIPYWFSSLERDYGENLDGFQSGTALNTKFRNYTFQGNTSDGILVFYEPEQHECLEVLTPADKNAPDFPAISREAAVNANLSRILPESTQIGGPPSEIFGPEPPHDWCYLYLKADLARQQGDWAQVLSLAEQAREKGYSPSASGSNTPFEWLPFIEGYARANRWQEAQDLSLSAFKRDKRIDARMCDLWKQMGSELPSSPEREAAVKTIRQQLGCP